MRILSKSMVTFFCCGVLAASSGCEKKEGEGGKNTAPEASVEEPTETTSETTPAPEGKPERAEDAPDHGVVIVPSSRSGKETYDALVKAIEAKPPISIMAQVDHTENASRAELELGFTRVVIFGNPKVGTPLMAKKATVGLDLPQRMLVYERDGKAFVAYNDPKWLGKRHGVEGEDAKLDKISGLLGALAKEAAGDAR